MKKKNAYNLMELWSNRISEEWAKKIDETILGQITKVDNTPPTPEEIKKAKLREKKEKIRRAKKMTLTVGEYEDLIEASYY